MTQHKNIHVALAAAQAEMGTVTKGSVNPAFKSKYADLADVVTAVAPSLSKHGIAFYHYPDWRETGSGLKPVMVTVLAHGETDTKIEAPVELIVDKNNMQGMKSATTYAKRIGLESVTGIAPEDDDGNAAAKAAPRSEPLARPLSVNADQFRALAGLLDETGSNEDAFLRFYGASRLEEFPADKFEAAIAKLNAKKAQKETADA